MAFYKERRHNEQGNKALQSNAKKHTASKIKVFYLDFLEVRYADCMAVFR